MDPTINNNCAIREAILGGHLAVVNRLLEDQRVDPSAIRFGFIASAAMHGYVDVVQRLIEDERIDPSADHYFLLAWAVRMGHLHVVKQLLKHPRVDLSTHCDKLNAWAAMAAANGHLDILNLWLDDPSVDPSANDNEAIRSAAWNGHWDVVNRLLDDPRVDPSAIHYSSIIAAMQRSVDVVLRLVEDERFDPSVENYFLISWASAMGDLHVVKRLLEHPRTDLSTLGDKIKVWAELAAENGHQDVVNLLLHDQRVYPSSGNIHQDGLLKPLLGRESAGPYMV